MIDLSVIFSSLLFPCSLQLFLKKRESYNFKIYNKKLINKTTMAFAVVIAIGRKVDMKREMKDGSTDREERLGSIYSKSRFPGKVVFQVGKI